MATTSTDPRRLLRSAAPPMRHALVGGMIGFVLSAAGAVAAIRMNLGPAWYPIALALSALPTAWLGGVLYQRRRTER